MIALPPPAPKNVHPPKKIYTVPLGMFLTSSLSIDLLFLTLIHHPTSENRDFSRIDHPIDLISVFKFESILHGWKKKTDPLIHPGLIVAVQPYSRTPFSKKRNSDLMIFDKIQKLEDDDCPQNPMINDLKSQ